MKKLVRVGRSILTGTTLLQLAAVLLAVVILLRTLSGGTAGLWAILLVLGATAGLYAAIALFNALRRPRPDRHAPEWLTRYLPATRSRLAAVLALLILMVNAAITGYVGIGTILIAVLLGAIATLLSPNLRLVALIGAMAIIFATVTVFAATAFRGSTEARALAVSVAAVVFPVLVSDKLVRLVRQPALTTSHHVILAVLTLTLAFLGWTREDWLPGVRQGCYTLPTSSGITVLRSTADGDRCYGLLDTADAGVFGRSAFGADPVTIGLQRRILAQNQPLDDGDLTVVWFGALSCDPAPADATRCADGRDYPSERDQLRALLFAQTHVDAGTGHHVHVVIADATQDVRHADDVAKLIVERKEALGERVVVIGGGDSRDTTQSAINRLLTAGIPFVAPNLLADLGAPGRPFVDRPGYFQLAPSNLDYARDTVARVARRFPQGFRMDIYQHQDPTDKYTTSLVNDLLSAVKGARGATARRVTELGRLDETGCDSTTQGPPTVLFFADRWTRFAGFVQRIEVLCGHSRPRMVLADSSVSRFMADYRLRAVSTADWPVDYYVGGPACADLTPSTFTTLHDQMQVDANRELLGLPEGQPFECADRGATARDGQLLHACTLDAAVKLTSQPCRANDLGAFLVPAWDAVLLADALLPDRRPANTNYLTSLNASGVPLATGNTATVRGGRLVTPTIPVLLWHVDALNDPTRIWERPSADLSP
ncbi:hypothetical protein [Cryptosporangium sp. NPDC051539]|uniref:hypothetical protein n=1 Tax=Cryptosporangium sp. NPDC051539 TaxID=3363962 RepID=UPI0037BD8879